MNVQDYILFFIYYLVFAVRQPPQLARLQRVLQRPTMLLLFFQGSLQTLVISCYDLQILG